MFIDGTCTFTVAIRDGVGNVMKVKLSKKTMAQMHAAVAGSNRYGVETVRASPVWWWWRRSVVDAKRYDTLRSEGTLSRVLSTESGKDNECSGG